MNQKGSAATLKKLVGVTPEMNLRYSMPAGDEARMQGIIHQYNHAGAVYLWLIVLTFDYTYFNLYIPNYDMPSVSEPIRPI